MKRVGVSTIWSDNYGTVLQGFALQQVVKALGYETEIIRHYRNPQNVATEGVVGKLRNISIEALIEYILHYKRKRMWHQGFADFKSQRMQISNEAFYRDSDFSSLNKSYDAFICGSDMLWSTDFEEDWYFFYLGFAEAKKTISYAPSFGKNEMSENQIAKVKPLIDRISHLSCREEAGVDFIKDKFNLSAKHVVDPTLLLTANQWNELLGDRPRLINDKYFLTYTFQGCQHGGREKIYKQLEKFEDRSLYFISGQEGKYTNSIYKGYFSPIEYVLLFRDADFIITDTFHGLIFSLIFNKPFIVLDKSFIGVSSDRQISTLKTYGFENRFVGSDVVIDNNLLNIDYTKANAIMTQKRTESLEFLKSALNDVCGE